MTDSQKEEKSTKSFFKELEGASMEEKFIPVNGLDDLRKRMLADKFMIDRKFRFNHLQAGQEIKIVKFRKSPKGHDYERGSYHIGIYADVAATNGQSFPVVIKFAVKKEKKLNPRTVVSGQRRRSSDDYDFHYSLMNIPHMNKLIMNCHKTCDFLKHSKFQKFKVNGSAIVHGENSGFHWLELELKDFKKFEVSNPVSPYTNQNYNKAYNLCNPKDENLVKLQVLMNNLISDFICDFQGQLFGDVYTLTDIEYASSIWSSSIVSFMDPTHLKLFTKDKEFQAAMELYHVNKTPGIQSVLFNSVLQKVLADPQFLDSLKNLSLKDNKKNNS